MIKSKIVYKYDNGGYYCWMGENPNRVVIHKTYDLEEAADFGFYEKQEEPNHPGCGDGKFVTIQYNLEIIGESNV